MSINTIAKKVSKLGKNIAWERDQHMETLAGWARRYNYYINDYHVVSLSIFSTDEAWSLSFSQEETDITVRIDSEKEGLGILKKMGVI